MKRFSFLVICLLLVSSCRAQPDGSKPDSANLDTMIGQMIVVGFRGLEVHESDWIHDDIVDRKIGGVVLFDYDVPSKSRPRNIESPEQVRKLTHTLQSWAERPLIIAIDQEGGRVNRLKPMYGFPPTPSAGYLGSIDNPDSTRFYAARTAQMLSDLGINLNIAPVVDVNVNPENPIIGGIERSFSSDPAKVVEHASIVIDEHSRRGIGTVLKHYPGHGSSRGDTHLGLVDVTDTWTDAELEPYRELLGSGYNGAIMTAHVVHRGLDTTGVSATLSKPIIQGLLRDSLGFDGVVFSDDLQMGAIREQYDLPTVVRAAIEAGVDVLAFSNNQTYEPDIAKRVVKIIRDLVSNGMISRDRIRTSYERIQRLKSSLDAPTAK